MKGFRRSKRLSIKMRRTSQRIPCSNPYSSSKFSEELNRRRLTTKTRKPSCRVSRELCNNHQKGVQRTKSGKYASFIWDRIKKKCVWLGTFSSLKEAREMYDRKKRDLEADEREPADHDNDPHHDLLHVLEPVEKDPKEEDPPNSEKNNSCLQQQQFAKEEKYSCKFVLRRIRRKHEEDGGGLHSKKDEVKKEKEDQRFGYLNGVQICDGFGYGYVYGW